MIERKEDMGKRGLESPDRADIVTTLPSTSSTHTATVGHGISEIRGGGRTRMPDGAESLYASSQVLRPVILSEAKDLNL